MRDARLRLLTALIVLAVASLLLGAPRIWGASDADALDAVWTRVAQSGAYRFSADVTQTSTPLATIVNAGRRSKTTALHMEGAADIPNESLHLTMWTNGGSVMDPASGAEVRVHGDTAVARQGNGAWQEIEGFTGLFAPGGDLLAYAQAADNVVNQGTRLRHTPLGEIEVTRFTFDVNGRRFAAHMRRQLSEQAVAAGMPAGVQMELPKIYVEMTGTGELWVGADGLPLRQSFSLRFPPTADNYATTAEMTVNFTDFAPIHGAGTAYRVERALARGLAVLSAPATVTGIAGTFVGLLLVVLVITHRRSRRVYTAICSLVIFSMLSVSLLTNRQIRVFAASQAAEQQAQEARQAEAEAQANAATQLRAPTIAPHADPLAVAEAGRAADETPGRYYDPACESDPDGDTDGDGLTNLQECLLGTLLDNSDTDQDGVADNLEVAGHVYAGKTWYLDPTNPDTNNDSVVDGKEWHLDSNGDGAPDDTDGDGIPDMWDDDNDNDGVRDDLDLSIYTTSKNVRTFSHSAPLELRLDNLVNNELTKVEFQLIPTNPSHLRYTNNVLDWPEGDHQGQIQDEDGLTFYDVDSSLDPAPNDQGDVRMVPMLEIEINGGRANLPSDDVLAQLGISVQEVVTGTTYVAYAPVQLVTDSNGDAIVAFYARMFYQPATAWTTPDKVRLVWMIQALNDRCLEFTNNECSKYDPDGMNELQVIQTYPDDWFLTGLMVTEEHSAEMALIAEDPTATATLYTDGDAPFYFDTLYGLLYGLDHTFLAAADCQPGYSGPNDPLGDDTCTPDGKRDVTVDSIYAHFNHSTNAGVSAEQRWNLPNVLTVEKNSYESIDLGMLDTTITQTVEFLGQVFKTPDSQQPITPTVMLAFEQTYRAVNLDESLGNTPNLAWQGNALTVDLPQSGADAVSLDTMASVKWTPYAFDVATGWQTADINAFYETLNTQIGMGFSDMDDPDEATTYATMGVLTYFSAYNGGTNLVQRGDFIPSTEYQLPGKPLSIALTADAGKVLQQALARYYSFGPMLQKMAEAYQSWSAKLAADESGTLSAFFKAKFYQWANDIGVTEVVVGVVAIFLTIVAVTFWVIELATHQGSVAFDVARFGLAAIVGTLLLALRIIKPIIKVIKLASTLAAVDDIAFSTALFLTLTDASSVIGIVAVIPIIGFLLSAGVALGMFFYAKGKSDLHAGSIAFNELLAATIAAVIVALIILVLTFTVVGAILTAVLSVIDTVLWLAKIKWSLTGKFTEFIAWVVYSFDLYTNLDIATGGIDTALPAATLGLVAGNVMTYTLPVTTTLTLTDWAPFAEDTLRRNSLIYALDVGPETLNTSADAVNEAWIKTSVDDKTAVVKFDSPSTALGLTAGINVPTSLYLNGAYALLGQSCWFVFCSDKAVNGNSQTALNTVNVLDVLPATLDEFVAVENWSASKLGLLDADGDGLLPASFGGLDPDDTRWDTDGDGLSDSYELTIAGRPGDQGGEVLDPRNPDGDDDGIPDGLELRWGLDPGSQDSDDDGLLDSAELLPDGGWTLPYAPGKSTRVWSNPLDPDADGDGLSDLFERTQLTCPTCAPWADPANPAVFNPNVWNLSPVALYVDDNSIDGYVRPGATVVYTSTTVNNLSGAQVVNGKLSVDAPAGFSAVNTEATVDVNSGQTESLVTTLTVDATASLTGSVASTMALTDFADTVWSWDAPRTTDITAANLTRDLDAVALTGWRNPILMVTHATAAGGIESMVAHVTSISGAIRQSLPLTTTVSSAARLTGPDIACTDDGDCLVVWGETDGTQTAALWVVPLARELPVSAPTRRLWRGANATMTAPTLATSNDDFMVTWATEAGGQSTLWSLPLDGAGNVKLSADTQEQIQPTAFHTTSAAGASSPQTLWDGNGYHAIWAENDAIQRANLDAATGAAGAPVSIHAGQGWLQSTGLALPPAAVLDPVTRQTLLLFRGTDNHLYGGRLNSAGAFAPLALDTDHDFSTPGVETALCADPKNGGWVAAWTQPGVNTVIHQAIGPDGTRRGAQQTLSRSVTTGLGLACSTARPMVDLDFEEAEGAVGFADASGFGNDAACEAGKCPLAGVQGRFGRAVRFNGAGEFLKVPNNADFDFKRDEDFTVSFWVLADATQADTGSPSVSIVSKWSDGVGSYPFAVRYFHATGHIAASRYDGANNPSVQSVQAIDDGLFHHVVFVKNGPALALYIDGVQSGATVTDSTTGDTSNSVPLYIGALGGARNFFTGTVDRLQIFPRALSLQEIGGIFDAASAIYDFDEIAGSQTFVDSSGNELIGTCAGSSCPTMGEVGVTYTAATFDGVDDVITVAPIKRVVTSYTYDFETATAPEWSTMVPSSILALKFDEAAGATVFADSSGAGHNASCSASTCPQAGVAGRFGQAVQFNGQGQVLSTSAGASVEMGRGDFAISAWINTTAKGMTILIKNNGDPSWQPGERVFYLNPSGLPAFSGNNNGYIFGKTPVNDGKWHHLVVMWDYSGSGTGGVAKMYVDGVDDTDPTHQYLANNADNVGNTIKIGQTNGTDGTGGLGYFSGAIDQVQIFSQILTTNQITQLSGALPRISLSDFEQESTVGLGDYYLGNFANEPVHLTLTDLPPHDTVKVRFNVLPWASTGGSNYLWGWDGNRTDEGRGPDRWEWGHDSTAVLNTSFAQSSLADRSNKQNWGYTQAYPSPYSVQAAQPGLGIFSSANQRNYYYYQDTPSLVNSPVGNDPPLAYPEELMSAVVHAYDNVNYDGQSMIWDFWAGDDSWDQRWPNWVSSMRIWPTQHLPGAGAVGHVTDGFQGNGDIYTVQATISDHTTDSIALYFQGQSSASDPGGQEIWGLDNVQVTLERDETSIPLNNQSFTLAAWAKRSAAGNWDPIITQGPNGTDQHLHFGFRGDLPDVFTCAFSKVGNALNSPTAYTDLDWHHWVCTYDVATNQRILYRDGVEIARDIAAGSHSGLGATYIGRNVTAETFHGQIDELGVWRQALAAADVAALYDKIKVEDQSVMVGTLFATDNSATIAGSEVVLRETATNVGAIQQTTARTLTVDADSPTVCPEASQCPLDDQYVQNNGTLIVAGRADDPTSYIARVQVDNGGWQTLTGTAAWSYAWDISTLADGEHTLPVRAYDAVGNISPVYAVNVIVDSTPPQPTFTIDMTSVQRPTQDAQGRWLVPLAGAVSDPAAGSKAGSGVADVEVRLDGRGTATGQGWQPATRNNGNWTVDYVLPGFDADGGSLSDPTGVYTVSVRAADLVGNGTPAGAYLTASLALDAHAPDVSLSAPLSTTQTISTALTLAGNVRDGGSAHDGGNVHDGGSVAAVEINLTPAEQIDALDGAVLHQPFDQRHATGYLADQSGANHGLTCNTTHCPTLNAAGQRDRAANFDGAGQYLATAPLFDPATTDLTVAAWFNVDALGTDRPIVQQSDGAHVGRAWLYVASDGTVQSYLGGSTLATTSKVNTGTWHHAAVVYDGIDLALYLDGVLESHAARTLEAGNGTMLVGSGKNLDYFFDGQLDELVIYDRALAGYEVANLMAYGQGTWTAASLDGASWRYALPAGTDGIEGYYQINARGIDALGNVTPQSRQRLWRGEIDTKPPVVRISADEDTSGNVATTTYTCSASDFNLDVALSCVTAGGPPSFRSSDITLTTYDQVDPWFAATIADTSRLYGMEASRMYTGTAASGVTVQACDSYGHCATAAPEFEAGPPITQSARLLDPSAGAVLTTQAPVNLFGHAYDQDGLELLFVKINDRPSFFKSWRNGQTGGSWSFTWTPPAEGVYRITPLLADSEGAVPLHDAAAPAWQAPSSADDLPFHSYVPLAMDAATPTRHMAYLPLAHKPVTARDIFTGTVATIYVDLTPPAVTMETTRLTLEQALGQHVVELSGTATDATQVHMVEVSIDGGPWDMAGVADGRWRYPWILNGAADGTYHTVTVRAMDVAGHSTEARADVTVDVAPPDAGAISYAYVTTTGATIPMEPGDHVHGATALVVTWQAAPDHTDDTRYLVGFSRAPVPQPDELTAYTAAGSHSQPVSPGSRHYAVVRYIDAHGNARTVEAGPFCVDAE